MNPLERELRVPELPNGPGSFVLLDWYCQEGDLVEAGALIADMISTQGILLVHSSLSGTVHSLGVGPGETLDSGEALLRFEQ